MRQRDNPERCCFGGIATCGQVWECLVCSTRIRSRRAGELQRAVAWHCERFGSDAAQLLTLTIRHRFGDELRPLRSGVARAWRRFIRGAPFKRFASRVGLVGNVRALEVTHGGNGWHPHLHVVLLARDPAQLAREHAWIVDRWQAAVVAELGAAAEPNAAHGVDLRACAKADYLAKLGLEVTSPRPKSARAGNRSPFEILSAIDAPALVSDERDPDERREDVYLWQTWCEDMKGARMLTWSRGLRVAAGLEPEKSDDEIVAEPEGDRVVAFVAPQAWDRGVRAVPRFQTRLLEAAEHGGAFAVAQFIAREVGPP